MGDDVAIDEPSTTIAAADLVVRARIIRSVNPPGDLIAWLLAERLAEAVDGGRLAPTDRCRGMFTAI